MVIYAFAGFVLLTIELLLLSLVLAQKQQLTDGNEREPFWWEQLAVLYHLPMIVLVAVVSRRNVGPYWLVALLTFACYLGAFFLTGKFVLSSNPYFQPYFKI